MRGAVAARFDRPFFVESCTPGDANFTKNGWGVGGGKGWGGRVREGVGQVGWLIMAVAAMSK